MASLVVDAACVTVVVHILFRFVQVDDDAISRQHYALDKHILIYVNNLLMFCLLMLAIYLHPTAVVGGRV